MASNKDGLSRKEEFLLFKEAQTLLEKESQAYQQRLEKGQQLQKQQQQYQKSVLNTRKNLLLADVVTDKHASSSFSNVQQLSLLEADSKGRQLDEVDFRWVRNVLSRGTLSDKIAANTLLIQNCPRANLQCLQTLIDMISLKSKREALLAMDSLRDLFLGDLLKERKLKPFGELIDSSINSLDFHQRKNRLLDAYAEDQLRQLYTDYLRRLEQFTHDAEQSSRSKAVKIMFELLVNNSEQEQFLLEKLVNKLGDPEQKNATQVVYLLDKLTNEYHPAMKEVIVKEVERLLYRPNISTKAQYNALCYLAAIRYVRGEHEVVNRVMNIFLSFFKVCIKTETINSKLMSILLTGISRAHPYSNLELSALQDKMDTIYKISHLVNFNIAIQAYQVIFNVISKDNSGYLGDRYFCAIYRTLLQPNLEQCSRKAVYLNLLYKTIKSDSVNKRIIAFLKRLLQIVFQHPSNVSVAILMLVSSVFKDKPDLRKEFMESFNKLTIENPLLVENAGDDGEEERYYDVDEEENSQEAETAAKTTKLNNKKSDKQSAATSSSWLHSKIMNTKRNKLVYDPTHRNPLYANADKARPFELCLLRQHYHPTVSLFTEQVIEQKKVDYDGDALYDFNVKSFLDKFVYKNPKQHSSAEIKQASKNSLFERNARSNKASNIGINQPGYTLQLESRIPAEERFIYEFLKNRRLKKDASNDTDSVTSDDFEQLVLRKFEAGFDSGLKDDIRQGRRRKQSSENDEDLDYLDDDDFAADYEDDADYRSAFSEFENDLKVTNTITADENAEEEENGAHELTPDAKADNADTGLIIDDLSEDSNDDSDMNDDEQLFSGSDDDDDDDEGNRSGRSNRKRLQNQSLASLLASADEFAHLLEDNEEDEDHLNEMDKSALDESDDDKTDEDALDFDDDDETLQKRKFRSKSRKEKDVVDKKIQGFKNNRMQTAKAQHTNNLKQKRQAGKSHKFYSDKRQSSSKSSYARQSTKSGGNKFGKRKIASFKHKHQGKRPRTN